MTAGSAYRSWSASCGISTHASRNYLDLAATPSATQRASSSAISLSFAASRPRHLPNPYGPSFCGRSDPSNSVSRRSHAGYHIYSDRYLPGNLRWRPRTFGTHGIYLGLRGYGLWRGFSYSNWTRSHCYYNRPKSSNIWCGALTSMRSRPS